MPQNLGTGFESMPVMNSFVWVAERNGIIIGALLAAPCHGLVFIARIRVVDGAPVTTVRALFRQCMKDTLAMGFIGYFSYTDPKREKELALASLCVRYGGVQVDALQTPLVGSIEKAVKH